MPGSFDSLGGWPSTASERTDHVWQAIDTLPEKLRLPIVLAGIEGHDISEVAHLLRLPQGTEKSRLFHARERMKESLRWIACAAVLAIAAGLARPKRFDIFRGHHCVGLM